MGSWVYGLCGIIIRMGVDGWVGWLVMFLARDKVGKYRVGGDGGDDPIHDRRRLRRC